MCALAGLRVEKLERVREGPLKLGALPEGRWRRLTAEEVAALSQGKNNRRGYKP